jgi:hypothetical protein
VLRNKAGGEAGQKARKRRRMTSNLRGSSMEDELPSETLRNWTPLLPSDLSSFPRPPLHPAAPAKGRRPTWGGIGLQSTNSSSRPVRRGAGRNGMISLAIANQLIGSMPITQYRKYKDIMNDCPSSHGYDSLIPSTYHKSSEPLAFASL